jgi:hypothetical protein
LWLIEQFNPEWKNLAADWFGNEPAQHEDAGLQHRAQSLYNH